MFFWWIISETKSQFQLEDAQAFCCSIQNFQICWTVGWNWSYKQTHTHTHITGIYGQHRCQASHSLTFTLLSRPLDICSPDRRAQGPLSTNDCLLQLSLHSWVESQIITGRIRLDSDIKGWGVGGYGGGFIFLSLCFSPPLSHVFFLPLLLLLLLLHLSIFSPPFCLSLPFWLAPFLKRPLWLVESNHLGV